MKKISVFLLVGMLIVFQPMQAYADAGTVAVVGGSIGTAGLTAAGMAGLAGPAVVIVFAAFMAAGMNVKLTQASQQAGMTKTEFLKSKIQQYCNEANITLGVFTSYILQETTVARTGAISLGTKAREQIVQFGNWLFQNDMVYDEANAPSPGTGSINDLSAQYLSNGYIKCNFNNGTWTEYRSFTSSNGSVSVGSYAFQVHYTDYNLNYIYIARQGSLYAFTHTSAGGGTGIASDYNSAISNWRLCGQNISSLVTSDLELVTVKNYNALLEKLGNNSFIANPSGTANDTVTGNANDWTNAKDKILNPGQVVNPGITGGLSIPADTDIAIDVKSYLDAIQKVLDKLANPSIPAIDVGTGTAVDIPIDDTDTQDPAFEDDEPAPTNPTPVIDPDKTPDPNVAIEPLTIQLKNVFPFCIPFDFVDMVKLLNAEPVAPSYTVNWNIPIINQTLTFTVDLSGFNSVASVLRTMELLAFCILLAIVTRSMFIRG